MLQKTQSRRPHQHEASAKSGVGIAVDWTLSEYLNLIELRSQTWCIANLASSGGFRISRSEGVLFYAVLEGSVRLSSSAGQTATLDAGDIAIVLSGDSHAVRCQEGGPTQVLQFLANGEYADAPIQFTIGQGTIESRVLCGRLKARWPGARRPSGLPSVMRTTASEACTDIAALAQKASTTGGTSILTRAAMLIFVTTFRTDPCSEVIFRNAGMREPIAQAIQFIETHPFTDWTVARLAAKVGMGRSNFALRFTEDVGKTPMTFVTDERMKHAAAFLQRTDLKVAEIADRIGYRSESAFSHRFFAHFGMTPGMMRSQRRSKPVPALQQEGATTH